MYYTDYHHGGNHDYYQDLADLADQKAGWQRWYWRIEKHLTSVPSQQTIGTVIIMNNSSPTILSQYILHIWNKSSWKKSEISQVLKKVKSQSSRAN